MKNLKTIRANGAEIRRRMQRAGLSGLDLAREAKVAEGTIAHALRGRPLQPSTFRAIAFALARLQPIPDAEGLIDESGSASAEANDG